MKIVLLAVLLALASNSYALSMKACALDENEEQESIDEHLYGGAPDDSKLYERRAYVLAYDEENLVPKWAAWHAHPTYRDTPKRTSRWKSFRKDPELAMVRDDDYDGW